MNDARSKLLKLAAEMVRKQNMPCVEDWPWPTRATVKLWGSAVQAEREAENQCNLWAVALRNIADSLPALGDGQ